VTEVSRYFPAGCKRLSTFLRHTDRPSSHSVISNGYPGLFLRGKRPVSEANHNPTQRRD